LVQDVAMFRASVAYPVEAEAFDFDYFRSRHAPMFAELLGDKCRRFEVHRALSTPGARPPPLMAAAYFWVTSPEPFGAMLTDHGAAIYEDIARIQPDAASARVGRGDLSEAHPPVIGEPSGLDCLAGGGSARAAGMRPACRALR
jgi:uncharacterized protein (TIGR02118 family)